MPYRVFGSNDSPVEPAPFLQHLHQAGFDVAVSFRGDDRGWFEADMLPSGADEPVKIERFLSSEEGIRTELHTWIAWLETIDSPHRDRLIRHFVATAQVFTLVAPTGEEGQIELCLAGCRYLAGLTDGIYQVDGQGLFAADGALMAAESL